MKLHEKLAAPATALAIALGGAACGGEIQTAEVETVQPVDTVSVPAEPEVVNVDDADVSHSKIDSFEAYSQTYNLQNVVETWDTSWRWIRGETADSDNFNALMKELTEDAEQTIAEGEPLSGSESILLIGNDQNSKVTVVDNFAYYGWNFEQDNPEVTYYPVVSDNSNYRFLTIIYAGENGELKTISVDDEGSTLPSDHNSFLLGALAPANNSGNILFSGELSSTTYNDFDSAANAATRQGFKEGLEPLHDPFSVKERI